MTGRRAASAFSRAALVIATLLGPAVRAADQPQCGGVVNNPELAIQVCTRLIEFGGLGRPELAQAYYTRGTEWASQGNHDRERCGEP